jgi:hypothetical protein
VVSAKFENCDEVKREIDNIKKELISEGDKLMGEVVLFMEAEVKASVNGERAEPKSRDTGRFFRSINGRVLTTSKLKDLKGMIYTDVEYAPYLENGTEKIKKRQHFNNSLERNKKRITEAFDEKIKDIVK